MVDGREEIRQRRRIQVQGIVQGVGFRPFVYTQASQLELTGFVFNSSAGVTIEIEGLSDALDMFQCALHNKLPPLARVDSIQVEQISLRHESAFAIRQSQADEQHGALLAPDIAMCDLCLHELYDPMDRRYAYPFLNCTNCGPRFTIVQELPYDRNKTTMRAFPLCPNCQAEYQNPLNRRFHAQPNACPSCGPGAQFLCWQAETKHEQARNTNWLAQDPLSRAAQELARGAILAIKGLGGYHLACNALDVEAVGRLRQRKQRYSKPFALMVPDLATARLLCEINEDEEALLLSRQRPIVLLTRRPGRLLAPEVAPSSSTLGLMLPYTPLHALLLAAFTNLQTPGLAVLVMTSGNLSDEPIIYQDKEAQRRLKTLAEGLLTHNREIATRCDDSVLRVTAGGPQFIRRARGYVPEPLDLPFETPLPLLACGGHLKNTFCLARGRQAFLSQHIGDLESLETLTSFQESIAHFQRLFEITPAALAYDLHPEYLASKYALNRAVPLKIGIQHHHAHIASVIAEHALQEAVIGIAIDGTGYGSDGTLWGCEILRADCRNFQRLAHLACVPLPGGEQAVRQPWRMAAVYLRQACGPSLSRLNIPFTRQLNLAKWHILDQMIARDLNCPLTSSLGRLFDAVAALLGLLKDQQRLYEGQAALELEQLASTDKGVSISYPFFIHERNEREPAELEVGPLIRALVDDIQRNVSRARIARRFHTSIAALLTSACVRAREQTGLNRVALSGGVAQNRLLLEDLLACLRSRDFQVYSNRRVPPNDGGLSFGQIAIAAARLQTGEIFPLETVHRHSSPEKQEVSDVSGHSR